MAIVAKLVKNAAGDWDLSLVDGSCEMAEDGVAAGVQMVERLLIDQDEAIKNPLVDTKKTPLSGVKWEGIVFDSSKSKEEKELEIKRVILSTPGYLKITYWSWTQVGRKLQLDWKVESIWGELTFGERIEL